MPGYKSWLCSSPLSGKLVEKALAYDADIIHFDLEDSVPAAMKEHARQDIQQCLQQRLPLRVAIRINAVSGREGLRDLLWLESVHQQVDIVILPKVENAGEIRLVEQLCNEIGAQLQLFAIIETLAGLSRLNEIAASKGMLAGLILGVADLSAQLGIPINGRGLSMNAIKHQIALAAATYGLQAIDSPCFALQDAQLLNEEIGLARDLGFSGKIAIHPSQINAINQGFLPSSAELARAKAILQALQHPQQGVNKMDGSLIGPPFVRQSLNVLRRCGEELTPGTNKS